MALKCSGANSALLCTHASSLTSVESSLGSQAYASRTCGYCNLDCHDSQLVLWKPKSVLGRTLQLLQEMATKPSLKVSWVHKAQPSKATLSFPHTLPYLKYPTDLPTIVCSREERQWLDHAPLMLTPGFSYLLPWAVKCCYVADLTIFQLQGGHQLRITVTKAINVSGLAGSNRVTCFLPHPCP